MKSQGKSLDGSPGDLNSETIDALLKSERLLHDSNAKRFLNMKDLIENLNDNNQ